MRWKLLAMPVFLSLLVPCFSEQSYHDYKDNHTSQELSFQKDNSNESVLIGDRSTETDDSTKDRDVSHSSSSDSLKSTKQALSYDQRVQVGGNYTYAWISPQKNPKTKGSLGGAQFLYEYRPINSVYTGVAFNYRIGSTDNDVAKRTLTDYNPQLRAGYTFPKTWASDRFTIFSGFGVRYMAEKVTIGHMSLHFDYTTLYMPLGFLFEKDVMDHLSVGCNFQWMPQVLPMVRIDLLDGAEWDLSYQLVNFSVEFPLTLSLCQDRCTLSFTPFFETWRDGKSTAKTLTHLHLDLPGNTYLFAGINVNAGWCF